MSDARRATKREKGSTPAIDSMEYGIQGQANRKTDESYLLLPCGWEEIGNVRST